MSKEPSNSSVILKNNPTKFKINIPNEVIDESFLKDNKLENQNTSKSLTTKSKNLNIN